MYYHAEIFILPWCLASSCFSKRPAHFLVILIFCIQREPGYTNKKAPDQEVKMPCYLSVVRVINLEKPTPPNQRAAVGTATAVPRNKVLELEIDKRGKHILGTCKDAIFNSQHMRKGRWLCSSARWIMSQKGWCTTDSLFRKKKTSYKVQFPFIICM